MGTSRVINNLPTFIASFIIFLPFPNYDRSTSQGSRIALWDSVFSNWFYCNNWHHCTFNQDGFTCLHRQKRQQCVIISYSLARYIRVNRGARILKNHVTTDLFRTICPIPRYGTLPVLSTIGIDPEWLSLVSRLHAFHPENKNRCSKEDDSSSSNQNDRRQA